ncbi:MAG: cell division protein SepF [Candidatus Nanopelagicaceae bacterium]|jgi:cell division inhibitor SepF|nr:cell division protein SepF [Candidatus Nanopelagicaceae bacterium]
MSNALRRMTNYLGLTEDDGTTQEAVAVRPKVAPVKRPTPTLSVAPQLPVAHAPQVQDAAPIDRIVTITPRFYSEARAIGEYYREGNPVIMNLSDMEESERKRLIDFASGLVFGHAGTIERVTSKVFLLSPPNVMVSSEDKTAAANASLFNQS